METNNFKHEVFGIKFNELKKHLDLFDVDYESKGEEIILVSKKSYIHEDTNEEFGDYKFGYKYAIEVIWNPDCREGNEVFVSLNLVVEPTSMNEKVVRSILDCCGLENVEDITISDVAMEGAGVVQFHCEKFTINNDDDLNYILDKVASIVESCDRLRGFYLDKMWNMIGSTGWDTIEHAVFGNDLFNPAIKRADVYVKQSIDSTESKEK